MTEEADAEANIVEFLVKASYLEIYNEQIQDLLDPNSFNMHLREDIRKGVYVEGLTEAVCGNSEELNQMMWEGMRNRHVGCTSMNKESSRSHSVFTIMIESKTMKDGLWNV